MKTVSIGRESSNDIVIIDRKVSRRHCRIVCDGGQYRISDCNSTNGTFVNNVKIVGETSLSPDATVRIGNTLLPWQTYFVAQNKRRRLIRLAAATAAVVAAATIIAILLLPRDQTETPTDRLSAQDTVVAPPLQKFVVKMREINGMLCIPVKINGQELDFVFDTGATTLCISVLEAAVLSKKGVLSNRDILGKERYRTASGDLAVGDRINLRTVQIGDRTLNNVEATVIKNPSADCLLGQTALSQFGKYTIDNVNNEIIFE